MRTGNRSINERRKDQNNVRKVQDWWRRRHTVNPLIIIIRGVVSGHEPVAVARAALRYYVTTLYNIDARARERGGARGRSKDEGTK